MPGKREVSKARIIFFQAARLSGKQRKSTQADSDLSDRGGEKKPLKIKRSDRTPESADRTWLIFGGTVCLRSVRIEIEKKKSENAHGLKISPEDSEVFEKGEG